MEQEQVVKGPMIIAMKGHPGTGKSTLAHSLSLALRCPLLDKDDVRDCTATLQLLTLPAKISTLLNDLSYDIIWQMASTQLRLGLTVILDSPLSRRAHLDRLRQLASSTAARLFIVECKPKDEAEWRRRLERRGAADGGSSWHKPSTWEDLERLLDGYGGCTDYEAGEVPKLVVDTTADVGVEELVSDVVEFIVSYGGRGVDNHQRVDEVSTRVENGFVSGY
ncbi:hypothetical protein L1049_003679 [Liquidambar formosana]|uniref:P-loop containing nucleoside triphosphate hydrolase protein n=1 Tax=Liquidambar formosana TaxID=63359 RepID=A0AAP0RRE3_LIQFO